ncbi:MAG: DUF1566 domain-containing protein, partial [Candidatus Wallbacteria bacterium]|nr:DUF1566 domain-containing protein [Candidatus Wallbacteria bacterium]
MSAETKFRLPDTGFSRCYDKSGRETEPIRPGQDLYGQDGCFERHPFSFTKLGADAAPLPETSSWAEGLRMVLDNNTGLVWEIKSPDEDDVNFCDSTCTWEEAQKKYVASLNAAKHGGFSDWRMPNRDELRSIVDYGKLNPAIDTWYFPGTQVAFYWCSDTYEMQPYFGWGIFFGLGSGIAYGKSSKRHVRAVRGGLSSLFGKPDVSRFSDNSDGTITDSVTGLMW